VVHGYHAAVTWAPPEGVGLLHLTTLGSLDLRRSDGSPVVELLRQRKRMAVLVYLTVGGHEASVSRETLRGLFWPDCPESRAQRALNQTVYVMRRMLGGGVIESRGDWDLVISSRLQCDATTFGHAIKSSAADALAVYAGDFLPGFSVPNAPEFERWVEATRGRLRLEAANAAAELIASARARGRVRDAVTWAYRRLELMPTDEFALRDLLTALAEAGDRAQAAAAYRVFAKDLAAYIETMPSPETQTLVREIVGVDVPLDRPLSAPLRTMPAPLPVIAAHAKAGSMRTGVQPDHRHGWWMPAIVAASIIGGLLMVRSWPSHGTSTGGDPAGSSRQTAATLSRVGRFFWNRRTDASLHMATAYFARALVADPRYAPALSGLADCYTLQAWYGDSAPGSRDAAARAAALAAVRLGDGLAETHASLGGVKAWIDHDWLGAETEYRRAIALDSNYATAHQWYALGLASHGRLEDAIREMRSAERHDPVSPSIATDLAMVLFWSDRDSEAISSVHDALNLDPTNTRARSQLWRVYTAAGRSDDALAALEQLIVDRGGNRSAVEALRGVYARRGLPGALEWWAQELERSAPTPDRAIRIAVLYALLDRNSAALHWLRRARDERSPYLQLAGADPAFRGLREDPEFDRIVSFR